MAGKAKARSFGHTRKLPSGRWQADYLDPDGRTYLSKNGNARQVRYTAPVTFDSREDAEAWLTDERRLISAGAWTPPAQRKAARLAAEATRLPTFGDYAERWIERRRVKGRPLAQLTKDNYRDSLRRFLRPTFGDLHLGEITPGLVNDWYAELCPDHPTQRTRVYSFARAVMNTAVSVQGPLPGAGNPFGIRGAGSAETRRRDEQVFTSAEVAAMLDRIREDRRAMILLALWCGLRYGEIVALQRSDIDLSKRTVRVRHSVAFPAKSEPVLKGPKSDAGNRDARIPTHLVPELKRLMGDRIGLLFPSETGGYLRRSAFYGKPPVRKGRQLEPRGHGWNAALTAAGRWHDDETKRPHFHDLRATGATKVARLTNNVAEVQRWLGDSTPQAAMRYMRATDTAMDEIADGLSALAEGGDW